MKVAIIYRSFLGVTKKYAFWMAAALKADTYTFNEITDEVLSDYETIIVASGTYAGWMPLTGFLKRKWELLKNKKVIVVSVGIAPDGDPYTVKILEKIPADIRKSVKIVRLPGAMFGKTPPETGTVKKENIQKVIALIR